LVVRGWLEMASEPDGDTTLYWTNNPAWDDHPVYGINWYEAEAYARFVGKRLPTEAEWEKAASWDADTGCRHTYTWGKKRTSCLIM
jgi:formylglycine-generating enzyme required for sulfatase activity